jgi:hypothetical protein
MSHIKSSLKHRFPRLTQIYQILRKGYVAPTFTGWGLTTTTSNPPWSDESLEKLNTVKGFNHAYSELLRLVAGDDFKLSQFAGQDILITLNSLLWRHYIVYWTALFAAKNCHDSKTHFVECGTCDGLTAHFALQAIKSLKVDSKMYLYDAWETMREEYLTDTERTSEGAYSYLDINNTKNNLRDYGDRLIFNKGYIPDSFEVANNPSDIAWLHIDLNASKPTLAALDFFYEKIAKGGIILLDDYAWKGYEPTKASVDYFFLNKAVDLLQLPTGQALIIKNI